MAEPRVSVLMPVYNAAPYLRAAVRSILNQSLKELELVAIDDGSRDASLAILQELAATDARVRVTTRANRGIHATRNELLAAAQAPIIAWMDADDVSRPDRLEQQVRQLEQDAGLVAVGGWVRVVDNKGRPMDLRRYPAGDAEIRAAMLGSGSAMQFPSVTMRLAAVHAVGGLRDLAPFEDFDLLVRLAEVGTFANVPAPVLDYRMLASSASHSTSIHWPAMRDFILAMAKDRRENGSDCLQRGESRPEFVQPRSNGAAPRDYLHRMWSRCAWDNGYYRTAFVHACHFVRLRVLRLFGA